MSLKDIFYSPVLKPFRDLASMNSGTIAVLVEIKRTMKVAPSRFVYLAKNMKDLRNKIRELHRVQVTMGIPISSAIDCVDTSRPYLVYSPLYWEFETHGKKIKNKITGDELPIIEKRWISHKKKGFEF